MNLIKKMLAVQAVVLVLRAVSAQATITDDVIAKHLEPVGGIYIQGKECGGVGVVAAAADGGGACSGEDIVDKTYNTCHGAGLLGAPKVGDKVGWGRHAKEQGGPGGLLAKTIPSISIIPPRGTYADYSDDELKAMIKHMSSL